jgi:hypothetical protein
LVWAIAAWEAQASAAASTMLPIGFMRPPFGTRPRTSKKPRKKKGLHAAGQTARGQQSLIRSLARKPPAKLGESVFIETSCGKAANSDGLPGREREESP